MRKTEIIKAREVRGGRKESGKETEKTTGQRYRENGLGYNSTKIYVTDYTGQVFVCHLGKEMTILLMMHAVELL